MQRFKKRKKRRRRRFEPCKLNSMHLNETIKRQLMQKSQLKIVLSKWNKMLRGLEKILNAPYKIKKIERTNFKASKIKSRKSDKNLCALHSRLRKPMRPINKSRPQHSRLSKRSHLLVSKHFKPTSRRRTGCVRRPSNVLRRKHAWLRSPLSRSKQKRMLNCNGSKKN